MSILQHDIFFEYMKQNVHQNIYWFYNVMQHVDGLGQSSLPHVCCCKIEIFCQTFLTKLPTIFSSKFIVEFDTEYINELVAVFEDYQIIAIITISMAIIIVITIICYFLFFLDNR